MVVACAPSRDQQQDELSRLGVLEFHLALLAASSNLGGGEVRLCPPPGLRNAWPATGIQHPEPRRSDNFFILRILENNIFGNV